MQIKFVEIKNFRKLKSVRIELADKTTLFVGANNSGKTSAMDALKYFLVDTNAFCTNDFTLSNWGTINKIGESWEKSQTVKDSQEHTLAEWNEILPALDVWLKVEKNEFQHVCHILPTLDWSDKELLGVRLRYEPKDVDALYKEYITAIKTAKETIEETRKKQDKCAVKLWPRSMSDFLEKRLANHFEVHPYLLDPKKLNDPDNIGIAKPQPLPEASEFLSGNPFKDLIRIDVISAQRGLSDPDNVLPEPDGRVGLERHYKGRLSGQLRTYYDRHINPSDDMVEASDIAALEAIQNAQDEFDKKLREGFSEALKELEGLGYPGVTDPKLIISTKIKPIDGLNHSSALQYEVTSPKSESWGAPRLPEEYNGLGYQNLISIVFRLMSFRDSWMKVGKDGKKAAAKVSEKNFFPPLHLVLIEEPEAHLHAQVQQVFIRKAYDILRNHNNLKEKKNLSSQLVVSTHSSHIAHECKFDWLRYFRRLPAINEGEVPISVIVNLSNIFGDEKDETQKFVTRYLKTTHCDLFFADAAILVEGPAERMLVPHFIHNYFSKLNQSYITLLEIGGSHAHRLRPLIEHLGLVTLIITDLDSAESTGHHASKQPEKGKNLITRNATLKTWLPVKEQIDDLFNNEDSNKIKKYDDFFSVRVAYQVPVSVSMNGTSQEEALSNTFEDALIFENLSIFKALQGEGIIKKFKDAILQHNTSANLGEEMFKILKDGKKAEFALELLFLQDPETLKVPTYINEGLKWLQDQLEMKQLEILTLSKNQVPPKQGS
ncbi:MAG: AAA family ATPase [Candidatus Omnitrophica bacterium]|nr:AAA family ATPase [Candidatus Omnitrophota bacterium]